MRISRRIRQVALMLGLAVLVTPLAVACGSTAPEALCGYIVGDGEGGRDTNIHKTILPGDSTGDLTTEKVKYVPCSPRNYWVNDGSIKDSTGKPVGDRHVLSRAITKDGTPVLVESMTYFTMNQSDAALRAFYPLCFKYDCFSDASAGGATNFSTPGWLNGVLPENFSPTIDDIVVPAALGVEDNVWRFQDEGLRKKMGEEMSTRFNASMRLRTGTDLDLFCGSGNSGWNPDRTTFNCTQVRIVVMKVNRYIPTAQEASTNPEAQRMLNQERFNLKLPLHNNDPAATSYWLGLQDLAEACKGAAGTLPPCQIVVGSAPGRP